MTALQFLWNCEHTWHKKHIDKSFLARFTCYCSNRSTSPFVIGNVSTQLSGYLFPIAVLPLTSVIGNMEWNLMMSATESNIWGKIRWIRVNIVWLRVLNETIFWNMFTHIIWTISCAQCVLFCALDKPNFDIVNLFLMIHNQYQGFKIAVGGAVSYQKCTILMGGVTKRKEYSC